MKNSQKQLSLFLGALVITLAACSAPSSQTVAASEPSLVSPVATATSQSTPAAGEAQPSSTPTLEPDAWQLAPVIPEALSEGARQIYLKGLELGRDPQVFSKVGDCGGTPSWFLGPFDLPAANNYRLGEYAYLEDVIAYYQGSYERTSLAAHEGFNTASLLSPIRADQQLCEAGENPLACEYRRNNPSLALIMLGTNDKFRAADFEPAMRQIIEYSIEQGVLPVLASKPDNVEGDHTINRTIYALSIEYGLPYWNLWRAVQDLPNGGLQEDGAHMTFAPNYFDDPNVMTAGWPHRNLTALQVLDFIRLQLEQ